MGERRGRSSLAALGVLVLLASGCARSDAAAGGGEEVDVCGGYEAYEELLEPDVSRSEAVVKHAASVLRILDRVDTDRRVSGDDVPEELVDHLETIEAAMKELRRAAAAAGRNGSALRDAESALFHDDEVRAADAAWATFHEDACGDDDDELQLAPSLLPGQPTGDEPSPTGPSETTTSTEGSTEGEG